MNNYVLGHLLLGPTMMMISLLFMRFPPRKINGFYGYRTPRSMKSQAAWEEGNRFGSKMLLVASILTCFVQVITFALVEGNLGFQIPAIVLVVGLLAGIAVTELHLKKKGF